MDGGLLIREARRRAGLTQADVAERLETTQSVVARWEAGRVSPTVESLTRAVAACGFEIVPQLLSLDELDHDTSLAEENIALTPDQRLDKLKAYVAFVREGRRAVAAATRR